MKLSLPANAIKCCCVYRAGFTRREGSPHWHFPIFTKTIRHFVSIILFNANLFVHYQKQNYVHTTNELMRDSRDTTQNNGIGTLGRKMTSSESIIAL